MASFLSPAAKVNTEQRPSKTATKAAKAPGKICLSDFFKRPFKGPSVCWQGSQLCCFVSSELHKTANAQEQARQMASDLKDNEKKRGGNYLPTDASKKLKQVLSKSHTMSECKGMIGTSRPVKQKRMEWVCILLFATLQPRNVFVNTRQLARQVNDKLYWAGAGDPTRTEQIAMLMLKDGAFSTAIAKHATDTASVDADIVDCVCALLKSLRTHHGGKENGKGPMTSLAEEVCAVLSRACISGD